MLGDKSERRFGLFPLKRRETDEEDANALTPLNGQDCRKQPDEVEAFFWPGAEWTPLTGPQPSRGERI